ncbi:hypothetical protein MUK42_35997 [Musa troglodytarum]|uniref:Uncharacterized protein n=1 Tax=Musa troglodytarum TaxID=320322 RepID=A0A9E7FDU5_9LILI|nr:hypothetical protein MUK42_35997 [Musa troglodytarum]
MGFSAGVEYRLLAHRDGREPGEVVRSGTGKEGEEYYYIAGSRDLRTGRPSHGEYLTPTKGNDGTGRASDLIRQTLTTPSSSIVCIVVESIGKAWRRVGSFFIRRGRLRRLHGLFW